MIRPGLVSITFRKLTPAEVVKLVADADLDGIEWGGDIHVPHGEIPTAREVLSMTRDAGLEVAAYGSYYRVGGDEPFEPVLESAQTLEADTIRVWAGSMGSADADNEYRRKVVDDASRIVEMASGITIATEYHGNTLTDTNVSTLDLLASVPGLTTCWQPSVGLSKEDCISGLENVLNRLSNLHVFSWQVTDGGLLRLPLTDGEEEWQSYFAVADKATGDRYALIEFVLNDEPEQFLQDAAALKRMVSEE